MTFQTVNPTTDEILKTYYYLQDKDVETKLEKARASSLSWRATTLQRRQELLRALGELLISKEKKLAEVITREVGKPLIESSAEIKKSADVCFYYADHLIELLERKKVDAHYKETFISFQPLGVVFAIMPWNFPFWQLFRCAIPALAVGNVILLKPADITSACAEEIEKLFYEIQNELHLLQSLRIQHDQASRVITDPRVSAVTFTGSTRGGRQIATTAAGVLKKTVLELGGSDAYIICDDADLEMAARICVRARLVNNGQSCIAGKRFLVQKNVAKKFIELFVDEMSSYVIGDPMDLNTKLGPMAHRRFLKTLTDQLNLFESLKAKRIDGRQPQIPTKGSFIRPCVLFLEKPNETFFTEEVFGPVALITPFGDLDEGFRMANQSPYGLGGGLFTRQPEALLEKVEKELQVGFAVINDNVRSDPRVPFGGVKNSGYGRELGTFGIYEFANIKTLGLG